MNNLLRISLIASGFVALIFFYAVSIHTIDQAATRTDFGKFYFSAQAFHLGKDVYTTIYTHESNAKNPKKTDLKPLSPNLNSPFFIALTLPLGSLNPGVSYYIWVGLSLIAGLSAIILVARAFEVSKGSHWTMPSIILAFFIYYPTFTNIYFGQVGLWMAFLLVLAWVFIRRDHGTAGGIFLGLAFALKLYVGLFLVYFVLRRQWRVIVMMGVTWLACLLFASVILGKDIYWHYYTVLSHINWYSSSFNASLYGYLARIFGLNEGHDSLFKLPWLTKTLYYVACALLVVGIAYFARKLPKDNQVRNLDLSFALVIVSMLLISPFGWIYYFPVLLIPFAVMLRYSEQGEKVYLLKILTTISLLLTSIANINLPALLVKSDGPLLTTYGYSTYALIMMVGTILWMGKLTQPARLKSPAIDDARGVNSQLLVICLLPSCVFIMVFGIHVLAVGDKLPKNPVIEYSRT